MEIKIGDAVMLTGEEFSLLNYPFKRMYVRTGDFGIVSEVKDEVTRVYWKGNYPPYWMQLHHEDRRPNSGIGLSCCGSSAFYPIASAKLKLLGEKDVEFWYWNNRPSHPTNGLTEEHRTRYTQAVTLWQWEGIERSPQAVSLIQPVSLTQFLIKQGRSYTIPSDYVDWKGLESYLRSLGFVLHRDKDGRTSVTIADYFCGLGLTHDRAYWSTAYAESDAGTGYRLLYDTQDFVYDGSNAGGLQALEKAIARYFDDAKRNKRLPINVEEIANV